jgi:hypothetical protein
MQRSALLQHMLMHMLNMTIAAGAMLNRGQDTDAGAYAEQGHRSTTACLQAEVCKQITAVIVR